MDTITTLARQLTSALRRSVVDLRYTADGRWAVFVPTGNIMSLVPGSICDTPEEALRYCLDRWAARSPESPFMAGYPTDEEWMLTRPNVRCWDTGIPSIGSVFSAGDGLHYTVDGRRLTEEHERLVGESTAR